MQKLLPALQFSEGRSDVWGGAKLLNAYSQTSQGDKADAFMVMAIPGLDLFSTVSSQPVRGVHEMAGTLYAVVGTTLYSITSAGVASSLGTVGGSLPVMMADNGFQLAIQGGALNNQGYVLDGGTLHTAIANLPPVSNVIYINGYFVWSVFESDQFIISALSDGLTYDPLDVATVEGDPDNIVGMVNSHNQILFAGAETIEPWDNTGAADFPFERSGAAFIERGIIDRNSLVKIDNSVHFFGNDKIVYRLNGYDTVRISTHAIEYHLAQASYFRAFTYSQEGSKFYIINTDVGTWGFDMSTGAWHERKSLGLDNYRVSCCTEAYGGTIMGDAYTGLLYVPNLDTHTENGAVIPVVMELPSIQTNRQKSTLYSVELQCETGVGNAADPDPQVILTYSRDGGRTFSAELSRSLGAVGEYLTRCIWRLGVTFRQLQIRVQLPSKTKRFAIAMWANIDNR